MTNSSLLKNKYKTIFYKLIFIQINILFIYKYGLRQNIISVYVVLLIYTLTCGFLLRKDIFEFKLLSQFNLKKCYFYCCIFILITIFLITFYTDGNSLNVDRWSAMDVAIRALLNGEYPYTAVDHLNGRTSNFPGLLILGIPFYLLGNVGYLQVFSFILLSYTLYKYLNIQKAFRYIILLFISPAFWWEIFAISDLMSNSIIVFCFIILLKQKLKNDIFKHPVFLGISTSFLVLTRGIFCIPLVLFVFKDFYYSNIINKLKYLFSFLITFIFLVIVVFINCPDLETLKSYNPLVLQTHYLPNYIHILALVLPFYFTFKIKVFNNDFFKITSLLILFPTLSSFILTWDYFGFVAIIEKNRFDLSYLSIAIPFILVLIVNPNKKYLS